MEKYLSELAVFSVETYAIHRKVIVICMSCFGLRVFQSLSLGIQMLNIGSVAKMLRELLS